MADPLSPEMRSAFMARIRGINTQPEKVVRKLLHGLGYRYRLHYRKLPGKPDVAFPSRRKVIFVHGCFWHSHEDCVFARIPKTNPGYWKAKFRKNRKRDAATLAKITELNWSALVIWECEIDDLKALRKRLIRFLGPINF
jgi:DNA mismatch endonuclease (patch repair protein)